MTDQATGWALPPGRVCVLCGHEGHDVRHGLIRWRQGVPYGSGPRWVDHEACHRRTTEQGEDWPVDDGRPAGPVRASIDEEPELDFGEGPVA